MEQLNLIKVTSFTKWPIRFPVCHLFSSGVWVLLHYANMFRLVQTVSKQFAKKKKKKRSDKFTLDFVKAELLIGQSEHTSGHADLLFTSTLKKREGETLASSFFIKNTWPG